MVPEEVVRSGKLISKRGARIISLVLALLTCMWLSAVQVCRFLKNCSISEACDLGFICSDKVESSTYLTKEKPTNRSLMRTMKDRRPNQEPFRVHVDKHWLARTLFDGPTGMSQTKEIVCWVSHSSHTALACQKAHCSCSCCCSSPPPSCAGQALRNSLTSLGCSQRSTCVRSVWCIGHSNR